MSSITDILFDGLVGTENTPYDIELYFKTVFMKYLEFLNILKTNTFSKIKEFINLYNNIVSFHNFYYKEKIFPICYLFMNINLNIEMIDFFLQKKFELRYQNEDKSIVYFLLNNKTIESNKIEILKYLNSINYDFSKTDYNGNNILHYLSIYKSNDNTFYDLCFSLCNEINSLNIDNSSPLLLATKYNNNNYIEFLLSKEACVKICNSNGNTCLMYACMNNNFDIVKKLIEKGAKVNAKDLQFDSPLMYACGCDNRGDLNLDLIKFLCMHLNNKDLCNISIEKYNALHYAAGCISNLPNVEVLKYLIDIGVNIDVKDNENKTFIYYLLEYNDNQDEVLNFLKSINLSVNIKNSLILNDYDKIDELNLFKILKLKLDISICNICHDMPNNKIVKCINNHLFDNDCILKWFEESNKTLCPLCFEVIDLSEIYFVN
tara:strand:+ start:3427 stop:4725 length:1299 start_codon:yes stop_codon:yes gene_type:complete